jgi:putative spermidine/putrescine transport system substrate-binding protein
MIPMRSASMKVLALLTVAATILSACTAPVAAPAAPAEEAAAAPESGSAMLTEVGPGEGQVNIVAWAGYIEDGSTDPAYDWVTAFEEATGCQVNVKTAGQPAPHRRRHRPAREP